MVNPAKKTSATVLSSPSHAHAMAGAVSWSKPLDKRVEAKFIACAFCFGKDIFLSWNSKWHLACLRKKTIRNHMSKYTVLMNHKDKGLALH